MKNIIRCELVQLHTVNEKKPMKKFVGRERETTEEKGVEHHPVLHRGLRDDLGAGEDSAEDAMNPSSLAFSRSDIAMVDVVQPTACVFADCFAILVQ
jgi:hypothetical protein